MAYSKYCLLLATHFPDLFWQNMSTATIKWCVFGPKPRTMEVRWHGSLSCCNIIRSCLVSYLAVFRAMYGSNWLFVVDSDLHWQFRPISAVHVTPFLCGSTKRKALFFFPKRFGRSVDVDASAGGSHEFSRLGFSNCIHFSSPVTIRWRKHFLSYRKSKISGVVFRFSICLSVNSCSTHFLSFWIFSMACKRFELLWGVVFSVSASWSCVVFIEYRLQTGVLKGFWSFWSRQFWSA